MKRVLMIKYKKKLQFKVILIGVCSLILANQVFAAVTTNGYWEAGVINGVSFPSNGSIMQQQSPNSNPDVFCSSQPNDLRMPLMAEMNIAYLNKDPWVKSDVPTNGPFRKRRVGSLVSEWGAGLNSYENSGWLPKIYWLAEPSSPGYRFAMYLYNYDYGDISTGDSGYSLNVVCVRTL